MRMYDVIHKKRNGDVLTKEEIHYFINGYVNGEIPDYQASALMMAIYFRGMNDEEMTNLTLEMAHSGDMIDLSAIKGIKIDKHSTGGVGDKTTLIVAPIVASCGIKVAKMSGRGLGHTGGTIDKLESIDGFNTTLSREQFFDVVNKTGLSVIGQSGNLAPADKKLYALRDVTATVESIPLIASSIMSKKLAAGSDCILLDVKTGSGAFMKTIEESIELAEKMVAIGEGAGRKTVALVTNMDIPLGNNVGNSLEVIEAVNTLLGNGPEDLTDVCIELAANMLCIAQKGTIEQCRLLAQKAISSGKALESLAEMVSAQGGDSSLIYDTRKFKKAKYSHEVVSVSDGFISQMNTESIGIASVKLGAGRNKKEDIIDYSAGIVIKKKYGDKISKGDVIATFYAEDGNLFMDAQKEYLNALTFSNTPVKKEKLIYARVTDKKTIVL